MARLSAMLMAGPLADEGWQLVDRDGTGARTLVPVAGVWPARVPLPRIEARPVVGGAGRAWWHWAAPAGVADIPIAPVNDCDRAARMLLRSLPKLAAAQRLS